MHPKIGHAMTLEQREDAHDKIWPYVLLRVSFYFIIYFTNIGVVSP
jgi:hypothetical protein